MLNEIVLVGTIKEMPVSNPNDSLHFADMKIECVRPIRSNDGEYHSDVFTVTVWRGVADSAAANYEVGNIVGIKGRLQLDDKTAQPRIIAERVSFIRK